MVCELSQTVKKIKQILALFPWIDTKKKPKKKTTLADLAKNKGMWSLFPFQILLLLVHLQFYLLIPCDIQAELRATTGSPKSVLSKKL